MAVDVSKPMVSMTVRTLATSGEEPTRASNYGLFYFVELHSTSWASRTKTYSGCLSVVQAFYILETFHSVRKERGR